MVVAAMTTEVEAMVGPGTTAAGNSCREVAGTLLVTSWRREDPGRGTRMIRNSLSKTPGALCSLTENVKG